MSALRVALAQLNATVGDLEANRRRIEEMIRRALAWRADLVVVPELALPGYPPEDLLLKPQFIEANGRALRQLVRGVRGITALVGFVDRDSQGRLYNAAAVISDGRHVATYHKQYLPNYGVFDEKRYFTPGSRAVILEGGGVGVGLTICEDLWEERPCQVLAAEGAGLVINLSASPYHAGKLKQREGLFSLRARRHRLAVAYCNLVGGQDELVFDGGSLILDAEGSERARGALFEEDLVLWDLPLTQMGSGRLAGRAKGRLPGYPRPLLVPVPAMAGRRPMLFQKPARRLSRFEEIYRALMLGVRDYVRKNGFSTVVLGLSGGVDSALTACIAVDALGSAQVMALVMPSRFSSDQTQKDAQEIARALEIECQTISIEPVLQSYLDTLGPFFSGRAEDITEQNIQARIRGNLLMAFSNKFGWLVLTTGNKSEMATGYTTLYGDMAGGFAVIKDVPKTLVYQLAQFRNAHSPPRVAGAPPLRGPVHRPIPESILRRAPTAELAPGQQDQDTLPPYEVLDRILKAYVEEDRGLRQILQSERMDSALVRRVLKMVDRSEYKRRQGPPGIKITPKAFGKDRRMPITNRFQQH